MKFLLHSLSVRFKLYASFLLLISFVLVLGVSFIILGQFIKRSLNDNKSSNVLSDAFCEGKYFIRSDMHIFQELIDAKTQDDFDYWWGEHVSQIQFFSDQLNKVDNELDLQTGLNDNAFHTKFSVKTSEIRYVYKKDFVRLFEPFADLKNKELSLLLPKRIAADSAEIAQTNIRLAELNDKYKQINKQVAKSGINIITQLDAGKNMVRLVAEDANYYTMSTLKISINAVVSVIILGVLFSLIVALYIAKYIARSVNKILNHVNRLGKGVQPNQLQIVMKDEFGDIQHSLNKLTQSLIYTTNFSNEIGSGNFESDFSPMGANDVLGNSLVEMRNSLKKAKEDEAIRRIQDERQTWAANGIAQFGDIMRQTGVSFGELTYKLISELVNYLGTTQGALFIAETNDDGEIYYKSSAAVAYGRERHIGTEIRKGEGLIGRAAYEAFTIYITEIPNDYVNITSGLGESNPNVILLVPVKLEGKVNGVIEMLSFNELEQYKVDFLEKVSENIASYIESMKVNQHTTALLNESKKQSEELAAQEEEMRQNLEELQATQEEVTRLREEDRIKSEKLVDEVQKHKKTLLSILDHIPIKIFLKDNEGKMIIVNKKVLDVHSLKPDDLLGKSDIDLTPDLSVGLKLWNEEQNIIKKNKIERNIHEETINNSKTMLDTTKYPFYIDYLEEVGILGIQLDITELKQKEKEIEELKKKIK